jgi:hypothetical protein
MIELESVEESNDDCPWQRQRTEERVFSKLSKFLTVDSPLEKIDRSTERRRSQSESE